VRNRIVAGISLAVVACKGRSISGSLITARLGWNLAAKFYGIPGNITAT